MIKELSARVSELVNMGWVLQSQTDTTATLTTRRPINWWLFMFFLVFLFLLGALIYLIIWYTTSRAQIFLSVEDGKVTQNGDIHLLQQQESMRAKSLEQAQKIKEQGFWKTMWPSVLVWVLVMGLWFWFFWWWFSYVV